MNNPLIPVSEMAGKTFRIPNYQRGYKWRARHVEELLYDISDHDPKELYCLQPLVLEKTGEDTFDVIDGQQRLSTIYIILGYIDREAPHFKLNYQTRLGSEEFLMHIYQLKPSLNENAWAELVGNRAEIDNIDNYYFYQAYKTVHEFFERQVITPTAFKSRLLNSTAFIWYEVKDTLQSSERVFQNFNSGKIRLTDAELIKAMVLLQLQDEPVLEIRNLRTAEFAFEWETIEAGLREKDFWWFLIGDGTDFDTRIDLLLQLEADMEPGNDDERKVYGRWEERRKNEEKLIDAWKIVVDKYYRLRDWYQDTYTYHHIGFITASGRASLKGIMNLSLKSATKSVFKNKLDQEIKEMFSRVRQKNGEQYHPYHIDNLHYVDEPGPVRDVLLWFNVLSYELLLPETRFPFWRYNDRDNKWSREHIHPQNPRELKTIAQAILWAKEQKRVAHDEPGIEKSLDELLEGLSQKKPVEKINNELATSLKEISQVITTKLELHKIGNMALLDSKTNSALGNNSFSEKRRLILETVQRADERFIPLATRNAFCKYYSKADENINVSFWSLGDANDYKAEIETLLKAYLPVQPRPSL